MTKDNGMAPLLVLANTVNRTVKDMGSDIKDLEHAVIGIVGETGEIADLYKRVAIYQSKALNDPEVLKTFALELGDMVWYIELMSRVIGYNLDTIIDMNAEKLKLRFPDKFNVQGTIDKADKAVTGEIE